MNKQGTILLIPEKILAYMEAICEVVKPMIKGFHPDHLKEVISIVACHTRKDNDYIPLKAEYIKRLVPQGDLYLRELQDIGIVEREGKYHPGQVSYKYRFASTYRSRFVSAPLNNQKLIRRIEGVHSELRRAGAKSARGRSEQIKYLKKLNIDPSYRDLIEQKYPCEIDRYNALIASGTRISNGEIFYNVDNTSGRFHSNVTNLGKDIRPFLRVDGKTLVNIDIKNSQPYLSTLILTDPSKVSNLTNNPAFALLLQTLKVSMNDDVKKYISLVVSGEIYEYLRSEFKEAGLDLTRNETKIQVLRILFARNRKPNDPTNAQARQVFIKNFPTVQRIFSKVRGTEKGDKFKNFKRFAILLQKIEAHLMLDIILKRIYRELPGVIAITIHDSIMTGILTNDVNAVKHIIEEELTYFVGFPPKIKIEREENREVKERIVGVIR